MTDTPTEASAVNEPADKRETGFYAPYAEFAKSIRTWFVAYGIGAPVLMLSQDKLASRLLGSHSARAVALLFLFGVLIQIVQAIVYKVAMWHLYMAELYPKREKSKLVKIAVYISEALWIELLFDLVTVTFFGAATVWLIVILTGAPPSDTLRAQFKFVAPAS